MSICHHTFELSIYSNLIVVLFKLKQIRWILIPFHVLNALLNNLLRNYLKSSWKVFKTWLLRWSKWKLKLIQLGNQGLVDDNEIIAAPIEDNIDDDILVVEKPQVTPKPNVDKDIHASTSVALTCVQEN